MPAYLSSVAVIVAQLQRAEPDARAPRVGVAADDELLCVLALELQPVPGPPGPVGRAGPLGDDPFPALGSVLRPASSLHRLRGGEDRIPRPVSRRDRPRRGCEPACWRRRGVGLTLGVRRGADLTVRPSAANGRLTRPRFSALLRIHPRARREAPARGVRRLDHGLRRPAGALDDPVARRAARRVHAADRGFAGGLAAVALAGATWPRPCSGSPRTLGPLIFT